MSVYNVHAGHNNIVPGASGFISEVTEDRRVKELVIKKLRSLGHTVYDCTDDSGTSQSRNLNNIVAKCNQHTVDLDVSIHFNAGGGHGVEVLVYSVASSSKSAAGKICTAIADLGFTNRGIKYRPNLAVLKRTKSPALLVECCFVDSLNDCKIYDPEKMATAIVKGITGQTVSAQTATTAITTGYTVRITASSLNVRKDHSASSAVVTTVKRGDVYTIVDEYQNGSTKWGKLKSGAGWISLAYTQKV